MTGHVIGDDGKSFRQARDHFFKQVIQTLPKGAFLSVSHGGRDNVMTIGWGFIGAGWIGLEVAAAARAAGPEVVVFEGGVVVDVDPAAIRNREK